MMNRPCPCGWGESTPASRCGVCGKRQSFKKRSTAKLMFPNNIGGQIFCGHERCISRINQAVDLVVQGARIKETAEKK